MGEQATTAPTDAPAKRQQVSMRTFLLTRFVAMMVLLTLVLGLIFYLFVGPVILQRVQTYVREALSEADVSEAQIDQIVDGSSERYFSDIRTDVRQSVLAGASVFFIVGLLSIYFFTTRATRNITALTQAARAIAKGDYKQDLSHIYNQWPRMEVNELAEAIEESGRVHIREQVLIAKVKELEIKIDEGKKQEQVDELTSSDFFQDLQGKAKAIRKTRDQSTNEST